MSHECCNNSAPQVIRAYIHSELQPWKRPTQYNNHYQSICDRYNIALNDYHRPKGKHFYRDVIWKYFESTVI